MGYSYYQSNIHTYVQELNRYQNLVKNDIGRFVEYKELNSSYKGFLVFAAQGALEIYIDELYGAYLKAKKVTYHSDKMIAYNNLGSFTKKVDFLKKRVE